MPVVEDNGVFEYDPEKLWAAAYALARPGWTPDRVKELLDELIRVGLLIQFNAQGKTWCYLVGSDKPGHLPPPSMRNSKFPLPPSYDKTSQSLRQSYDEPSRPLATPRESFLGLGLGSGLGPGSGRGEGTGTGLGTGERKDDGSVSVERLTPSSKTEDKIKDNSNDKDKNKDTGSAASAQSVLEVIQLLSRQQHLTGITEIQTTDPLLSFLAKHTDELVEYRRTHVEIPPPGWNEDEEHDDEEYEKFIEVGPDDPRYPGFDPDKNDNGLNAHEFTLRDNCAGMVYSTFKFAMDILEGLVQYLPDIALPAPDIPEGAVQYRWDDISKVMKEFLGDPKTSGHGLLGETTLAEFWAITWWAFKKSSHWPSVLKTLDDVIKWWPTLRGQYERYYISVPDGKKPHDRHIGTPYSLKDEEERPEMVAFVRGESKDDSSLAVYLKGEDATFDDEIEEL
jgi:hypothetical protein